jgi:release factor glutamine methyltransferase
MQVKSNKLSAISSHYNEVLGAKFQAPEARFLLNWLLESILDIPSAQIALHSEDRVSESDLLKIHFGVKDLLKDRPIQHIVGKVEFDAIQVQVNEHVLIPRPETEELVSFIQKDSFKPKSILDIGTGSGVIAISLQKAFKVATTAVEVDAKALEVAIENSIQNNAQVAFIKMDALDQKTWNMIDDQFDLIVSNPPYVREQEKSMMAKNVLDYDPSLALFVDDDNALVFYESILQVAQSKLSENGHIWLEINEYLAEETAALFKPHYSHVEIIQDFRDKNRFIHIY